ncbi:phospholipase D family protein [Rubrobacter indicoceani]|uniref:phospholipase D family protein n=1 Tax=Rubrobacter indicoceani TaxID=2051957 RepID=UPI000E5B4370|nr:phospholipase D family protein [Rubrobacter indicoceani]
MTIPRKENTNPLFQDALLDDVSKLGVVRARFEGFERSSFEDLISGYSSLKVLTYSSSLPIVNRAAEAMDSLEVVFGRADILGDMASYMYYQELLIRDLISATKGRDHVKEKIDSGAIKLYVVQEIISHEKLFLLEGEKGTRVITGSANFSDRAFSGVQNESYVLFDDDPAAWDHFSEAYRRIRDRSTTSIIERAQIDGEFDPENLPALSPARTDSKNPKVILIQDAPSETSIVQRAAAKPPKRYGGIASTLQAKGGVAKIDRPAANKVVRYVKENWRTREENPEESMSLHLDSGEVLLSGKSLDLNPPEEDVARDARFWLQYFDGYSVFRGQSDKLARGYFTFWSWFYAGAFVCDLRNAAIARGDDVWDYPVYGLLYGKSNCGKSELVKTLLSSMFDRDKFPPNDWFTKSYVPAVMEQNGRYPLVFDDMDKTRFSQHADALIKDDHVGLKEYPCVVLSMNAGQDTFDSELRKRALVIYTGASLPDHTGEARELRRKLKAIKGDLGTALYREYLKRVIPTVRDDLHEPLDLLELSSSTLAGIISEHSGGEELPPWCEAVTMEGYGHGKHDRVAEELLQLWSHDPAAWTRSADKIVLRSDDVHGTINKIKRDVPDYLYATGSRGNVIVFYADHLEEFLGTSMKDRKSGPFEKLVRLFRS